MPETVWQSNNGDMGDAASWTLGVPNNTTLGLMDGKLSQRSATAGLTFATKPVFVTTPEFLGDIGQPGNPLILNGSATVQHIFRGRGRVFHGAGVEALSLVIDSMNLKDAALLKVFMDDLFVKAGRVVIDTSVKFTGTNTFMVVDGELANVVVEAGSQTNRMPDTVRVVSGRLENKRDFEASTDRIVVLGGEVMQTGLFKSTMRVHVGGGIVRYEPATDPASELPFFMIDGGVLDVRGSQFAIPRTAVHVGRGGKILGSAIDKTADFTTTDLKEDYP